MHARDPIVDLSRDRPSFGTSNTARTRGRGF